MTNELAPVLDTYLATGVAPRFGRWGSKHYGACGIGVRCIAKGNKRPTGFGAERTLGVPVTIISGYTFGFDGADLPRGMDSEFRDGYEQGRRDREIVLFAQATGVLP